MAYTRGTDGVSTSGASTKKPQPPVDGQPEQNTNANTNTGGGANTNPNTGAQAPEAGRQPAPPRQENPASAEDLGLENMPTVAGKGPGQDLNAPRTPAEGVVSGDGTPRSKDTVVSNTTKAPATESESGGASGETPEGLTYRLELYNRLVGDLEKAKLEDIKYYDKTPMVEQLNQQTQAAKDQHELRIDNAVDQQALDLQRALQDAEGQFQAQQDQITANELNALDNSALYAEARGDKGGIGQAQYNSIQNNAAQNRVAVSQAQTKLATDTTRQIADLRAQGEFDKADGLLDLTQAYLTELRQIEEYAASYNLSVDQLNTAIDQWEYEFNQNAQQYLASLEMSLAEITGMWNDGTPTYAAQQQTDGNVAGLALQLLASGVKPSKLTPEQKAALQRFYGMDDAGLSAYYNAVKPKSSSSRGTGASYTPTPTNPLSGEPGNATALNSLLTELNSATTMSEYNSALVRAERDGVIADADKYIVNATYVSKPGGGYAAK